MLDAVTETLKFVADSKQKDIFKNRLLALALVKEIEMLGEAASKVSKPYQSRHPDVPWQEIISTRNRLIHGYFDIDYAMVWNIVKFQFQPLKSKRHAWWRLPHERGHRVGGSMVTDGR